MDGKLKQVCTSLMSNKDYHGKLTTDLSNVLGNVTDDDERVIIENELVTCTELDMDAHETLAIVDAFISLTSKAKDVDIIKLK